MTDTIPTESTVTVKADDAPTWAIVELLGHVKHAGRMTEEDRFGSKVGRLDIPDGDGYRTMYFGGASVYRVQVVSEAVARHVAKQTAIYLPVASWDFPQPQPALPASTYKPQFEWPNRDPDLDEDGHDDI